MDYSSVHLLNANLVLVSPEEVAQLEQRFGTKMPAGYQNFVTTFGLGVLNETVRVYTPKRISHEIEVFRQRWNEY